MNFEQVRRLCAQCDLGELQAEPSAVPGGLLHRMWRLETERGRFAVKVLNPTIMACPDAPQNYRNSEIIARQAARHGLPAIAALIFNNHPLVELEGVSVLIFKWVEGLTLPTGPDTSDQAHQIGAILGRLHNLKFEVSDLAIPDWPSFPARHWQALAEQSSSAEWAVQFRAKLPTILTWSERYRAVGPILRQTLVVSHRDLDQKNVLWRDAHTPQIIDWEAAGLTNPALDITGLALDWSGLRTGQADRSIFEAAIRGYREVRGAVWLDGVMALWGVAGGMLDWLEFNLKRSLGQANESLTEQRLGQTQVIETLTTLENLTTNLETWSGWI